MKCNIILSGFAISLLPIFLFAQKKEPAKKSGSNPAFITMPMMTKSVTQCPSMDIALKRAMKSFIALYPRVGESITMTSLKITNKDPRVIKNERLPTALPSGEIDWKSNSGVAVDVKYSNVSWNAEFIVTKDIDIRYLEESQSLVSMRLFDIFYNNLDKTLLDSVQKIRQSGHAVMLKAGKKFSMKGLYSMMDGLAKDENWVCGALYGVTHTKQIVPEATIKLIKATTLDAKSVSVDYEIKGTQPYIVNFDIYRSHNQSIDNLDSIKTDGNLIKLGSTPITGEQLALKEHDNVDLLLGLDLIPDTRMPYIIVVATLNNQKQQIYFKKWMLGAVSHGFDPSVHISPDLIARLYSVPQWETNMTKKLTDTVFGDGYDDVIAFDWMRTCATSKPYCAVNAGADLALEIWQKVKEIKKIKSHAGDVVDIQLIGHSRGAVVVAEALVMLSDKLKMKTDYAAFGGSYIELTLLDPHPANNTFEAVWCSTDFRKIHDDSKNKDVAVDCDGKETSLSTEEVQLKAYFYVYDFQDKTRDQQIQIPGGVNKIEIWFQHTPAYKFCNNDTFKPFESKLNLWGMASPKSVIWSDESVKIDYNDLTNYNIDGIGVVGHGEVPLVYEQLWVDTGTLNRSKTPEN
jgi:hypothetical protein